MALETRRGYKPNHKSFGAFMLSQQAYEPVEKAAKDIRDMARTLASKETGKMAASYRVVGPLRPGELENPRVYADVINDDPAAIVEEFGRGPGRGKSGPRRKPNRTLRKAGERAALPVIGVKGW